MRLRRSAAEPKQRDDQGRLSGVYFFECEGFIKIGISSNVRLRYNQVRSANPHEVNVLGFVHVPHWDDCAALEAELHEKFKTWNHRAEWFIDSHEIRWYISEHARPLPE